MIKSAALGAAACAAEAIAARQEWQRGSRQPRWMRDAPTPVEETEALLKAGRLLRAGDREASAAALDGVEAPSPAARSMREVLSAKNDDSLFDGALRLWFPHVHPWMPARAVPISGATNSFIALVPIAAAMILLAVPKLRGQMLHSPLNVVVLLGMLVCGFALHTVASKIPTRYWPEISVVTFILVLAATVPIAKPLGMTYVTMGIPWGAGWIAGMLWQQNRERERAIAALDKASPFEHFFTCEHPVSHATYWVGLHPDGSVAYKSQFPAIDGSPFHTCFGLAGSSAAKRTIHQGGAHGWWSLVFPALAVGREPKGEGLKHALEVGGGAHLPRTWDDAVAYVPGLTREAAIDFFARMPRLLGPSMDAAMQAHSEETDEA